MTEPFVLERPEDALAAVPVVLGFEPCDSVVLLTFGARDPFHARIDLPPPGEDDAVDACVAGLLAPSLRHGVRQVIVVLYSGADRHAARVARALRRRFEAAHIEVRDVLQVHDRRWFRPLDGSGTRSGGAAHRPEAHPFRARAVFDGRVVVASRAELAARLAPVPAAVAAVAAALPGAAAAPLEGAALRSLLERARARGTPLDDRGAARVLLAVREAPLRDHAWVGMTRADAGQHVGLWTDLVRRAPDGLVAGAAAVLALAAWLRGDGAFAWCAVDRCLDEVAEHSLGRLVADLLDRAVPPSDWRMLEQALAHAAAGRAG